MKIIKKIKEKRHSIERKMIDNRIPYIVSIVALFISIVALLLKL